MKFKESRNQPSAFFLWVGSEVPDIARISVLSAVEAGFDTVLFTDRKMTITQPGLRVLDWREINLPWMPEQVQLRGASRPYFAGFADLFRYALLSQTDGWWFDCDTIIMRSADDFSTLGSAGKIVLGYEDAVTINNAVIGSRNQDEMRKLKDAALTHYPVFERWGVTGPRLVTRLSHQPEGVSPVLLAPEYFYPVHHGDIAKVYLPQDREALEAQAEKWYCLSLWGEVLSRSGLKHLQPPRDSFLGSLLAARPGLGTIAGDSAAMANYLAENQIRLEALDSGRAAAGTLLRKAGQRVKRLRGWPE